jgi:arginyl-tRNA synthetase
VLHLGPLRYVTGAKLQKSQNGWTFALAHHHDITQQIEPIKLLISLRQLDEKGLARDIALGDESLEQLVEPQEISLVSSLIRYPEILEKAALQYEPHLLVNYLRELAAEFHSYYNAHQFIVDDAGVRNARLNLSCAVKQVLANGLNLLRINTPEAM